MRPTRPSADPNAPYRAAIQALAEGYPYVDLNESQTSTPTPSHELLSHLTRTQSVGSHQASSSREQPTSSSSQTQLLDELKIKLKNNGDHRALRLTDDTIMTRLRSINISLETLSEALKILDTPSHPTLRSLKMFDSEISSTQWSIGTILKGRLTKQDMIEALQRANDDPEQLISEICHYNRSY